jgi:hypothetical protein
LDLAQSRAGIANIFHRSSVRVLHEWVDHEGKRSTMEMSIVEPEMIGTQEGYWMEVGHTEKFQEPVYAKVLVTPESPFHRMVFVMPDPTSR